ncbi:MAG: serine/threonine protein kinase [Planctomycetes bacterium]|nr:serine/threonine protein kinase [Planctomycetota bacterium]
MLADADILAGKVALGRGYVSRDAASRIAAALVSALRQGHPTSFASAGVRLGLLPPQHAEALSQTLEHGALVCRGTCGRVQPLRTTRAHETLRCVSCGGPVYVGARPGQTVMELDVPPAGRSGPPAPRPREPAEQAEVSEETPSFTYLELEVPDHELEARPPTQGQLPPTQRREPPTPRREPPTQRQERQTQPQRRAPGAQLEDVATRAHSVEQLEQAGVDWASAPTALGPALPPTAVPTRPYTRPKFGDAERDRLEAAASGETTLKMAQTPGSEFTPFRVADDVEAEAPLGRGAGGTVLRGRRLSTGEPVAIKILGKPNDEDALARFNREVMIGGRLGHSGIVQVYDTGTVREGRWQGHPYCLMEFVAGRDVDAWATEAERDLQACVALVAEVCDAVHHAHGKGVIHRDLKPGNILVRWEGDAPVVCDFGLSKYRRDAQNTTDLPSANTKLGVILGTPSYMSPEQARGDLGIGPGADVYALGAVLYRLLTGDAPFRGDSPFETIKQVVRDKPKAPSRLNPKVPPALDEVVLTCLAKQPLKRFHGARALRDALLALKL